MKKWMYLIVIIAVAIAIAAFYLNSNGNSALIRYDDVAVSQGVLSTLHGIANNNTLAGLVIAPAASVQGISAPSLLLSNNKPEILYIGADYCPFCASARWGIVLALMRFGNFTRLHYMTSSASDAFASTPTFTFYNSIYQSSIINFTEVEQTTNNFGSSGTYTRLQNMTNLETLLVSKYDNIGGNPGGIPFIDFANSSVSEGAPYLPSVFHQSNWSVIISQLSDSNNPVSQAVIGAANIYTAQICKAINNTANACSQNYVGKLEK